MTVTKVEIALLVLAYLKDEKFKETHEVFQKESAHLLSKLTAQTKRQVKSLSSILNEYLLLKDEQKKKTTFMQSFGRDPVVKSTMSKLVTLLDDFSAYRSSVSENTHNTNLAYQDMEPKVLNSKTNNTSSEKQMVKMKEPQQSNTDFTSNVNIQGVLLPNNTPTFTPTLNIPTVITTTTTTTTPTSATDTKQKIDFFPSPTRRKAITPKKLKPSTESTVTPTKKNLSFDTHSYSTPLNTSTNSLSTSISPKVYDEESIVRALMADIQFQEKLAEQINTHLPPDTLDLPSEFLIQQQQQIINNPPVSISTNAVQEIINNLASESALENYFNTVTSGSLLDSSFINTSEPLVDSTTKRKAPSREEDSKRNKPSSSGENTLDVDVSNLDVDDFLSKLNYSE